MKILYKNSDIGRGGVIVLLLFTIGLLFFVNWIGWLLWVPLQ